MPLISLASPKGGVGKTMLTANLAHELQRLGWQTVVVDFDLQNALRLHFAMLLSDSRGFANADWIDRPWEELVFETPSGVLLLPFGTVPVEQARTLRHRIRSDRNWLRSKLAPFLAEPDVVVLADLLPGHSIFLEAVSELADLDLAVLMADATSIAMLPRIECGEFFADRDGNPTAGTVRYVVNQLDLRRRLNRDVLTVLRTKLGERLLGVIYRDEYLSEAVASQRLVADFAPESKASYDIAALAANVDELLAGGREMPSRVAVS